MGVEAVKETLKQDKKISESIRKKVEALIEGGATPIVVAKL